jgi:hypothetical protein
VEELTAETEVRDRVLNVLERDQGPQGERAWCWLPPDGQADAKTHEPTSHAPPDMSIAASDFLGVVDRDVVPGEG